MVNMHPHAWRSLRLSRPKPPVHVQHSLHCSLGTCGATARESGRRVGAGQRLRRDASGWPAMTALALLTYIGTALLLQLVVGIGVAVGRRRGEAAAAPSAPVPVPTVSAAWSGWRDFRVTRREFEDPDHSQCSFYLAPLDGAALPAFVPGQFLTFAVAAGDDPASPLVRCYSLSEPPDPTHYRITVKRALAPPDRPELPAGKVSNHLHDAVHVGDVLKVRAPAGRFVLDPDPDVPVVLVAGGIGIAPLLCMLRECLAAQPGRRVHLYYGARDAREQAFGRLLTELAQTHPAFRLHLVCDNPAPGDGDCQHAGYIDVALLRRTLPAGRHQFYVCGPTPMMESLVPALAEWGVPLADIRFEAFGPASIRLGEGTAGATGAVFEVLFRRSGRTLQWDGKDASLLDFAERHGILVESGCRSGSCGSCETVLVEGSVGYAHTPDYPVAAGCCLPCVGTPRSRLVLDA